MDRPPHNHGLPGEIGLVRRLRPGRVLGVRRDDGNSRQDAKAEEQNEDLLPPDHRGDPSVSRMISSMPRSGRPALRPTGAIDTLLAAG